MAVYVVTWNLNRERSNYDQARNEFIKHLEESYEAEQDEGLESVRFISSSDDASKIDADLRKKMDANDRLFVSRLRSGEHQGWLDESVWKWIDARL